MDAVIQLRDRGVITLPASQTRALSDTYLVDLLK
jgi:hypothetical protein